jgi:hypothetical protein
MKLFFDIFAMNSAGHVNQASVAFEKVACISEFTPDKVTAQLGDRVKCIMLCGDISYFICDETREELASRIEREWEASNVEYVTEDELGEIRG